jgi:imidazolonepropionase-like amidohydrolase
MAGRRDVERQDADGEIAMKGPVASLTAKRVWPALTIVATCLFIGGEQSADTMGQRVEAVRTGAHSRAFVGATLIDGTGRPPVTDAIVLVRDGRIAEVTSGANVALPAGTEITTIRGKFIIPGLIDGHAHYRSWVGELCLNYGVTSVVDVGNPAEWMLALREGMAKGKITRLPRIYASGNALSFVSDSGDLTSANRLSRPSSSNVEVSDATSARRAVVKQLDVDKFEFVSIFSSGFSPDMLKAVMEETHKRGKRVFAHLGDTSGNVYDFVGAGGDGAMHLYNVAAATLSPANSELFRKRELTTPFARMDPGKVDEMVSFLVARHVYLTPELVYEHAGVTDRVAEFKAQVTRLLENPALPAYIPTDVPLGMRSLFDQVRSYRWRLGPFAYKDAIRDVDLNEFRTGYRNAQAFVRKFAQAGGKVEAGTDASGGLEVPGLNVLQEVQLLADSGLTPMQALQTATSNPAEAIGVGDQVGTIQPGRLADMVVLDADPLQNIDNIHKIAMVIQGGERVDPGYHRDYSLPIANPDVVMDTKMLGFNPAPQLYELSPKMGTEGDASGTLKVSGVGFIGRSQIFFNGAPLETHFDSDRSLSAALSASAFSKAGTWWVQVVNPPPGGGRSAPLGFIVGFR